MGDPPPPYSAPSGSSPGNPDPAPRSNPIVPTLDTPNVARSARFARIRPKGVGRTRDLEGSPASSWVQGCLWRPDRSTSAVVPTVPWVRHSTGHAFCPRRSPDVGRPRRRRIRRPGFESRPARTTVATATPKARSASRSIGCAPTTRTHAPRRGRRRSRGSSTAGWTPSPPRCLGRARSRVRRWSVPPQAVDR